VFNICLKEFNIYLSLKYLAELFITCSPQTCIWLEQILDTCWTSSINSISHNPPKTSKTSTTSMSITNTNIYYIYIHNFIEFYIINARRCNEHVNSQALSTSVFVTSTTCASSDEWLGRGGMAFSYGMKDIKRRQKNPWWKSDEILCAMARWQRNPWNDTIFCAVAVLFFSV
jgi:hypothetical protein